MTKLEDGGTITYSYDTANELTVEENLAARITYSYDANGNTEVMDVARDLTANAWDIENHMSTVELPDNTLNTMTYDGDGKRRSYEDSAALRKFIWDGENILWQTDSANSAVVHYTHRPQTYGELVCPGFSWTG